VLFYVVRKEAARLTVGRQLGGAMSAYVNQIVMLSALLVTVALFLNRRNILVSLAMTYRNIVDDMFRRSMEKTPKLVVQYKYTVPAGRPKKIIRLRHVDRFPVVRVEDGYPKTDLWVIGSFVRIIGPYYFDVPGVTVDRKEYLLLAPGDTVDNPHFGGMKPEALVNPEISRKYRPSR